MNEAETRVVGADASGARLDGWLAGWLGSRAAAQRAIAEGRVDVDGEPRAKSHRLEGGESVTVAPAVPSESGPPGPTFAVVWEDEHLLVVDKPAGLVVHPAPGHRGRTLAEALGDRAAGGEDPERAGIVHRLDRDTSGLLVVARSQAAHTGLADAIRTRAVLREYLALVHGQPSSRTGTIDAAIGRDRRARARMSTDTPDPREARTHFELERAYADTSLLRVRLETGRTHQIRVHMEAIGHPVCGDRTYGGRRGELGLERQFLHAARLAFAHPLTGERIDVRSPLPPDLAQALQRAEDGA